MRDAILQAILADPSDDLPRLAYADLLEEQGDDARAEFIRLQIDMARDSLLGGGFYEGTEMYEEACRRERTLLGTMIPYREDGHAGARQARYHWSPRCLWYDGPACTFRRGFVAAISLPCAAFLEHAAAIFAVQPVEAVTMTDRKPMEWTSPPRYTFHEVGMIGGEESLPPALYRELITSQSDTTRRGWDTKAAALTALSTACVTYGRRLAGIPPLTCPVESTHA